MNEGWLAVCHRQTTWAGPVVHSQSVWQSCDGGMRDDSGSDAAHSSTTRCVMPLCVRRVTAQREPTRGSWVRHETDIGTVKMKGLHIMSRANSYLRNTNILMISMPEGEVNSQRPLFFTPSTILVQLCLGVVHSLLGQYINVLQYNTRVSVLY